ncbi:DUF4328 domain-containing protein [Pseudonocardia hierapolitana]|uniref:DUF4328 domain-containing protein n=1 Tax=Pseudonocardia hierapolitana TaxID=1128676 RepID=UPI0011BE2A93|nr:DUF4328 domain-containing protein [Pseudonocardia hierapolitana]
MSGLAIAVTALGIAVIVAYLPRIVASWWVYSAMFTEPQDGLDSLVQRLDTPILLLLVGLILLVPALIAAAVTTLVWVHRAGTNAAALSPHLRPRYTPAASVGLLLIPLANLWFLRPVLEDLCTASSPYTPDARGARLVRACWATTVVTATVSLLGNLAMHGISTQLYGPGRPVDETLNTWMATAGLAFATVEYLLAIACTVLFARVVRHISRQQAALLPPPGAQW